MAFVSAVSRPVSLRASVRPSAARSSTHVIAAADLNRPELKRPELRKPEPPKKLFDESAEPSSSPSAATTPAPAPVAPTGTTDAVTVQYQRARAKEMRDYFVQQQLSKTVEKAQVFGWTKKNEISNGRWVMFGLLVGMLTEYATAVDFPDQLKLMASYLGLVDLE